MKNNKKQRNILVDKHGKISLMRTMALGSWLEGALLILFDAFQVVEADPALIAMLLGFAFGGKATQSFAEHKGYDPTKPQSPEEGATGTQHTVY